MFMTFTYFLVGLFEGFFCVEFLYVFFLFYFYTYLRYKSLLDMWLANIPAQFVACVTDSHGL